MFLTTLIKLSVLLVTMTSVGIGYYYLEPQKKVEELSFYQQYQQYQENHIAVNSRNDWDNIKIITDYSYLQVPSNQLTFIQKQLVTPALAYLSQMLKVKSRISHTVYSPTCASYNIPNSIRSSQSAFDLGIIIIGVNGQNQNWWMRGVSCELEGTTNRPILGTLQINLAIFNQVNINQNVNEEWQYWFSQTLHELIHMLAFNSVLYPYYINPNTNQVLGINNVVKTFFGRQYIILPQVLSRVQKHFKCNNAVGALLEDNGGPEIIGFHWERVTFGNEIMTGDPFPETVLSEFTLSLLEGSGWYQVDYQYAQNFIWGQGEGCLLTQGSCNRSYDEFCETKDSTGCSSDFKGLGGCYANDRLAQGCQYWREQSDCRYSTNYLNALAQATGEYVGVGSKCMTTDLGLKKGFQNQNGGCFKAQCVNGQIEFYVGNKQYFCKSEYQHVVVTNGVVICPDIERFCKIENNCPNDCSQHGTCNNSQCRCWKGYSGSDCSNII